MSRAILSKRTAASTSSSRTYSRAASSSGRDPTALVGGRVAVWEGNLRGGGDALYVVEADEYDRSFLTLSPRVAVVTNIEADHLDIYRDLDDIQSSFARFVRDAAAIVLCDDDSGARLEMSVPAVCL